MASSNGTTFGASIVPVEQRDGDRAAPPISVFDLPAVTPAASHEDLPASNEPQQHIPPSSPFYQSPTLLEPTHVRPSTEKDLEAGVTTQLGAQDDNPFTSKVSVDYSKECAMWPSKHTLIQNKKAEQRRKRGTKHCGGCGPLVDFWARFNARQKLIIKIVTALFLIGVAIAIGVGISLAVNGTVYVSDDHSSRIPMPPRR